MLRIAQEMFKLHDYDSKLLYLLDYYPILMKSYIEKAIENYVKPVILNYHNQFSSTDEMEEVFYERTGWILYLTRQNERHLIWAGTSK